MSKNKFDLFVRLLDLNGVEFFECLGGLTVTEYGTKNGKLYSYQVDITDWTTEHLLTWLGY